MLSKTYFQLMCNSSHQLTLCSLLIVLLGQTLLAADEQFLTRLTTEPAEAGSIFEGSAAGTAKMICSGTLISCDLALTAAHCVKQDKHPDYRLWFFLQHAGFQKVSHVAVEQFCDYHPCSDEPESNYDLALIRLETPAWNFKNTGLKKNDLSQLGPSAKFVGFGFNIRNFESYNLKRHVPIHMSECETISNEKSSFCSSLNDSSNSPCHMDSGGPVYSLAKGNSAELIGIAIRTGIGCRAGQGVFNSVSNPKLLKWLNLQISESNDRCGNLTQSPQQLFSEAAGWLDDSSPLSELEFEIDENFKSLLVTMNHSPGSIATDTQNDFDLDLLSPSGENFYLQSQTPKCNNTMQLVSECRMENPKMGLWRARVSRLRGEGHFQLVATGITK